jgi:hypothetical protein
MRGRDASGGVGGKKAKTCVCLSGGNVGGSHCLIKSAKASAQQFLKRRQSREQSKIADIVPVDVSVDVPGHSGVDLPCFAGVSFPSSLYVSCPILLRSRDTRIFESFNLRRQVISTQTWPRLSSPGCGLLLHESTSSVRYIEYCVIYLRLTHLQALTFGDQFVVHGLSDVAL